MDKWNLYVSINVFPKAYINTIKLTDMKVKSDEICKKLNFYNKLFL